MRKSIALLSIALTSMLAAVPAANAITISVLPDTSTVATGSPFSVNVVASGLGEGSGPSLGVYDLNFSYDASVLSFANIVFGTGLDVEGLGFNAQFSDFGTPGIGNIFELSFNSTSALNSLQHDAFTLFTLTFNALGAGTSALNLAVNQLGDAEGNALTATTASGSVAVSVPEPAPIPPAGWLLLAGLALFLRPLRDWGRATHARTADATPGAQ